MARTLVVLLAAGIGFAPLATAKGVTAHPCTEKAKEEALKLLKYYTGDSRAALDDAVPVKALPPVPALHGPDKYDVLEVAGNVYKAGYRMRILFAPAKKAECLRMGAEILDLSEL